MVAVVLLAACSGGDDEPQAIEPTSESIEEAPADPEETAPEEPGDPDAIPDEIDEAYVQSVVDAVLPIPIEPELEAFGTAPHTFPPDAYTESIRATYSPDEAVEILVDATEDLADESAAAETMARLESAPEARWTVTGLDLAEPTCIVLTFDYPEGGNPEGGRAVLLAGYEGRDANDLNPTPWVIDRNGPVSAFTLEEMESRCTADQLADDEVTT